MNETKLADWSDIKRLMLEAPDGQLDPSMFPLIEAWGNPPSSLQILEVIDHCIHAGLASGFTVSAFQTLLRIRLIEEGKKLEDITPFATWRNE